MSLDFILNVLLFIFVALAFGVFVLFLSIVVERWFRIGKQTVLKSRSYECGFPPLDKDDKPQIDLKYLHFLLMFLLFEVEFLFLIPWAFTLDSAEKSVFLLFQGLIFAGVLMLAWFYALKKNAFQWEA